MNRQIIILSFYIFTILTMLVSCGGGGGSDSSVSYAGVWRVSGSKVRDDCNSGVSAIFNNEILVNQNSNNIVVDSGQWGLTGTTDDDDGFTVAGSQPRPNNCQLAAAYSFKDASDGNANVGFAINATCSSGSCTVAYGGTATRLNNRKIISEGYKTISKLVDTIVTSEAKRKNKIPNSSVDFTVSLADEIALLEKD